MSGTMSELSAAIATMGANFLVQSTVVACAALLAVRWFARTAAVRNAIYRATLIAVVVSPLACLALGRAGFSCVTLSLPRPESRAEIRARKAVTVPAAPNAFRRREATMIPAGAEGTPAALPATSAPGTKASRSTWLDYTYLGAAAAWALGAGALLLCLAACHLVVMRRRKCGREVADHSVLARLGELCVRLNVRRPRLLVGDRVKSPMLFGLLRPAIIVPHAHERELLEGQLERVLIHELAHLARHDCAWNLLSRIVCSVGFFQPLLWVLARRLEDSSDEVADDHVLSLGADGRSYANDLADIAERFLPTRREGVAGVGVIRFRSSLGRRVSRILDSARELVTSVSARSLLSICATAAVLTIIAASLGLRTSAAATEKEQANKEATRVNLTEKPVSLAVRDVYPAGKAWEDPVTRGRVRPVAVVRPEKSA